MFCTLDDDNRIMAVFEQNFPPIEKHAVGYPWSKVGDVYDAAEPLWYAKERYIKAAGADFSSRRDAVRFVELGDVTYGFDCAVDDITNFMAAFTPLLVNKTGTVFYKVWLNTMDKAIVELNYEQMLASYNEVRRSQLEAYAWYEEIKNKLLASKDQKELEAIFPLENS